MSLHARAERGFEHLGRWIAARRWWIIVGTLLIVGLLGAQMQHLRAEMSLDAFFHASSPTKIAYNEFREQFGRDELIVLAIEPSEIFNLQFLRTLKELHTELEQVPGVDDVTSLANIRATRGEADRLIVDDLLEELPQTPEQLEALRTYVLGHPLYRDLVISADARLATINIETDAYSSNGVEQDALAGFEDAQPSPSGRAFITGEETSRILREVERIVARYEGPDFPIFASGSVVITSILNERLAVDMPRYLMLSIGIIGVLLFALLRRLSAVILPLVVVLLSVTATLGVMGGLNVPITIPMQILPSLLLSVGVGYTVHLLVVFFQHFDATHDRVESVAYALGHSGVPILMTGLTTVVGLLGFLPAELAPISSFGVFAPLGVALSLLFTLLLLPAALAATPMRVRQTRVRPLRSLALVELGRWASRHPYTVIGGALAVAAAAGLGTAQLQFSADPLLWLPEGDPQRDAIEMLDERLGGTLALEVVVDTRRENGLYEPDVLRRLDSIRQLTEAYDAAGDEMGRTVSIVDVVKESHQALNENRPEFYAIPDDRDLVAQELLLFENSGSDDLEEVTDSRFQLARFTIRTPWIDAYQRGPVLDRFEAELPRLMGPDVDVELTGVRQLITRASEAVVESMATSYLIAFALITPLMILLIGEVRAGFISMVPNLLPIAITLGLIGALAIPFDTFSLQIGCIAISLAVDDTIHMIHAFRRYLAMTGDPDKAITQALETTGTALLFTSLVLAAGFFVFTASYMQNVVDFGWLTGIAILTALACDVLITPALLTLLARARPLGG
jgi:predicted RND superfamily exporter protein